MVQIAVSRQQPPVLGNGVYYKDLKFRDQATFIRELTDWVGGFVSRHRAANLIMEAGGIDEVIQHMKHAPTSLNLQGKTWRVYVDFYWGRTAKMQWWVSGVSFYIVDTTRNISQAQLSATRERLREKAELRQAMAGIPARKAYFELEKFSSDFDGDLAKGKRAFQVLVDEAYEVGKEIAKMPANPIGPDPNDPKSILWATAGAIIGVGTGEVIGGLQRAGSTVARNAATGEVMKHSLQALGYEAREIFDATQKAIELGDKVKGRMIDNNAVAALADLVEIGLSLSKFAGPFAPFASVIIGSFIDFINANQAGPVSRIRSHMYACYAAGFVDGLISESTTKLDRPGDEVFYKLGQKRATKFQAEPRYNVQVAMMEYVLRQPMGEWSLNPMFAGSPPFPSAYIRYWSPDMLKRAIILKLCRPKYLYKDN
ncbi:MAG: hypothetical protein PSX80_05305 [bacterium]|nr:hypothetical protein [bacterium]